MGNGYGQVAPDDLTAFQQTVQSLSDRVKELERPTGTQLDDVAAKVLQTGSAGFSQSNFAVTPSPSDVALASIPVPAGFTNATIMLVAEATAFNGSAAAGYFYASAVINGSSGAEVYNLAAVSTGASVTPAAIRTLTGLSGGTISVAVRVRTQTNTWPATSGNLATVNAIAIFRR